MRNVGDIGLLCTLLFISTCIVAQWVYHYLEQLTMARTERNLSFKYSDQAASHFVAKIFKYSTYTDCDTGLRIFLGLVWLLFSTAQISNGTIFSGKSSEKIWVVFLKNTN